MAVRTPEELAIIKQNRLDLAWRAMVMKQKEKLKRQLATGWPVTVSSDRPSAMAAAKSLIETGFAHAMERGEKRVNKGPMPTAGRRRLRTELKIIRVGGGPDDERI